jgi:hypothetical protein
MGATCFKSVTINSAMHARLFLHALAGQVQAEQQAKLDAAVLAAHAAAEVNAAAQLEAAAQREAKLQAEAAAATKAATKAAKAHAGLQHELELARQETAKHKATAEREARLRLKAQKAAADTAPADQQRAPIPALQHGSAGEVGHVAPSQVPPDAAFRVSGAGTVECNGWYRQFGNWNGKPDYYKVSDYGTCSPNPTLNPHCAASKDRLQVGTGACFERET